MSDAMSLDLRSIGAVSASDGFDGMVCPEPRRKPKPSQRGYLLSPLQARAGRAALGWNRMEMSLFAGVAPGTVKRFEDGKPVCTRTACAITDAILEAGFEMKGGKLCL